MLRQAAGLVSIAFALSPLGLPVRPHSSHHRIPQGSSQHLASSLSLQEADNSETIWLEAWNRPFEGHRSVIVLDCSDSSRARFVTKDWVGEGWFEKSVSIPIGVPILPTTELVPVGIHGLQAEAVAGSLFGPTRRETDLYGVLATISMADSPTVVILVPYGTAINPDVAEENAERLGQLLNLLAMSSANTNSNDDGPASSVLENDVLVVGGARDACIAACKKDRDDRYKASNEALRRCEAGCLVAAADGGALGWLLGPVGAAVGSVGVGLWCLRNCSKDHDERIAEADRLYAACIEQCK